MASPALVNVRVCLNCRIDRSCESSEVGLEVGVRRPQVCPPDALAVMQLVRPRGSRRRRYHHTLGDLTLRENGCRVMAIDFGTAATRELCGSERGDRHEFERSHEVRRTDHRAPAATPKKIATRTPIAAAESNAMRSLRFTARSCRRPRSIHTAQRASNEAFVPGSGCGVATWEFGSWTAGEECADINPHKETLW